MAERPQGLGLGSSAGVVRLWGELVRPATPPNAPCPGFRAAAPPSMPDRRGPLPHGRSPSTGEASPRPYFRPSPRRGLSSFSPTLERRAAKQRHARRVAPGSSPGFNPGLLPCADRNKPLRGWVYEASLCVQDPIPVVAGWRLAQTGKTAQARSALLRLPQYELAPKPECARRGVCHGSGLAERWRSGRSTIDADPRAFDALLEPAAHNEQIPLGGSSPWRFTRLCLSPAPPPAPRTARGRPGGSRRSRARGGPARGGFPCPRGSRPAARRCPGSPCPAGAARRR